LPHKQKVKIEIYNILGQLLNIRFEEEFDSGFYSIPISFNYISSGIYIYKVFGGNDFKIGKMMYIK
jgi:hypothetical protein